MSSSRPTALDLLHEKRRLFCFSVPNIVLLILSVFMIVYSYTDEPPSELKFIADSYGDLGNATLYLRHCGRFAFAISLTTPFAFIAKSLLVHFVFCTLIVALIVIQMNSAVLIYGDARVDSIEMKQELQLLINGNKTSPNHLLVAEIQQTLDCCGTTAGFTWSEGSSPYRSDTCCPFGAIIEPATNLCPFELSKLNPCDKAATTWVKARVWKYFGIFCLCALFESALLILVLPAIFTIKPSYHKN